MRDSLISHLDLDGRFMRSVALERDLRDMSALDGYLVTHSTVMALRQIGEAVHQKRAQRAWKIVGPYGSGKSALGLLVAQLLVGPKKYRKTFEKVSVVSKEVETLFRPGNNRFPMALAGSRTSLGEALASQIEKCLTPWNRTKSAREILRKIDFDSKQYSGKRMSTAAADMLDDFTVVAREQGYAGILLLIDELGKFIEHAALHPDEGDLIVLQQIAEMSCRQDDDSLVVVAMLHQHFSDYATGVGRELDDEWHKVSSRFEEISFDEPIERYVYFAAHALGVKKDILTNRKLRSQAKRLFEEAVERGILRFQSTADAEIIKTPQLLYPLHPLSIAALAVVAKRYGQSERSFHAFLKGYDRFAVRDFAQRNDVEPLTWLGLQDVYDFISSGHGLRFRDLSLERRWEFSCSAIERADLEDGKHKEVMKCIAVLDLVQPVLRLVVGPDLLQYALEGVLGRNDITAALESLVNRGVLLHRSQLDEYVLAVSEEVNIDALYQVAAERPENELLILGVGRLVSERTVIANRHYDRTGTIRTMGVIVGMANSLLVSGGRLDSAPDADGVIRVILVEQGNRDQQNLATKDIEATDDPLVMSCVIPMTPEGKRALIEYSKWRLVTSSVQTKRIDPWTAKYVEARTSVARESVEQLILSALSPERGKKGISLWHLGKKVPGGEMMNLTRAASWLFDTVYSKSPVVINELINKARPAPPIVQARQRLFELLLSADRTKPMFKENEFPPERLVVSSHLVDTGIVSRDCMSGWLLHEPVPDAPIDISTVWTAIGDLLRKEECTSFSNTLDELGKPPYGLRAGTSGIWIITYLIIRRSSCAIFERGTFVLELTAEHIARMFKNPDAFKLRELPADDDTHRLLLDYREVLAGVGRQSHGELTFLEVSRSFIKWASTLPSYSMETLAVSADAKKLRSILKRATDPVAMLTTDIPSCFSESKSTGVEFREWLMSVLAEIGLAYRRLQDSVVAALGDTFGISGDLKKIRMQLQNDCSVSITDIADVSLKGFLLRCTDITLSDEKWLDSLGSLIVKRPLDAWNDDTLSKFTQSLLEMSGHYSRWLKLVRQTKREKRVGERFLSVTLTLPGGQETSVFIPSSERAKTVAKSISDNALKDANGDRTLVMAALAQALFEFKSDTDTKVDADDERRTTG